MPITIRHRTTGRILSTGKPRPLWATEENLKRLTGWCWPSTSDFRDGIMCAFGCEPMLSGILRVGKLPPQCTFWRFLASLHLQVARQLLEVQRGMRQRV